MKLRLPARAKINLHLDVGPRRKDGYHNLKTLFQEIELHDILTFVPTPGTIKLTISPAGLPTGPDNLVVKALTRLRDQMKVKQGLRVHLIKHIPVGAGLGGGSADAAAALWGGWMCWNKMPPRSYRRGRIPSILKKIAPGLGADVPFFLKGGRAWAGGIGDQLRFASAGRSRWMVLVYPRVHSSTKEAYQALDRSRERSGRIRQSQGRFNSFEPVMMKRYPEIGRAKEALIKEGAREVMMSGSGSAVFGFVKSRLEGQRVMRRLKKNRWDLFLTQSLG